MNPIILVPIALVFLAAMIVGRNEIVKRRLTCPRNGLPAEVDLVRRSLRPRHLVRIESCSLLPDPRKVDCGQDCLRCGA